MVDPTPVVLLEVKDKVCLCACVCVCVQACLRVCDQNDIWSFKEETGEGLCMHSVPATGM